jgi:hypothetical protein
MNTYTKLKNGNWGIRVDGPAKAGQGVEVYTKAGDGKVETIERVLWSGPDAKTGKTISLCSIAPRPQRTSNFYSGATYTRRECKTGGMCSSIGNGRNCGAEDCDGY